MSYLYVKSSLGTCVSTAGRLTKQTGAFGSGSLTAGNVYASISSAITNGAVVAGDVVMVSDVHAFVDSGAGIAYTAGGLAQPGFYIISVDDTACDDYKPGASETTTFSGGDVTFNDRIDSLGVDYQLRTKSILTVIAGGIIY